MRYALSVLTMKGREKTLAETLWSFEQHVTPEPAACHIHVDGKADPPPSLHGRLGWEVTTDPRPVGFCGSTARAWEAVAAAPVDWVFWLEDDFRFVRALDLTTLAAVMDVNPQVAQMTLYRNSYSDEDRKWGGYLNYPYRAYERRATNLETGVTRPVEEGAGAEIGEAPWFEHNGYWTTNPSLFRREIPAELEWPNVPGCEGQFGFEIRAARPGVTFGIWGGGSVWVEHFDWRNYGGSNY